MDTTFVGGGGAARTTFCPLVLKPLAAHAVALPPMLTGGVRGIDAERGAHALKCFMSNAKERFPSIENATKSNWRLS